MANFVGSLIPALVWGVAFTNLVHGLPLSRGPLLGGLSGCSIRRAPRRAGRVAVFAFHGSLFLSLKTSGALTHRALNVARTAGAAAVVRLAATLGGSR